MLPPQVTQTVKFYHLPSTGGANQPYGSSADVTTGCAVLPLDRKDYALEGVDLIDARELYAEASVDIRVNDKVILANETGNFYCRHIFKAAFGGLPHQRLLISRSK